MSVGVGIGLAVVAALALAAQGLAVRVGTADRTVTEVLTVVFVVNVVVLLPVTVALAPPALGLTPVAVAAFAAAGLLGSLAGRACYFVGIARIGASRAEPLRALTPIFAVGAAWLVLGETITPTLLAGVGLLVLGGAVVATEARASPTTATGRQLAVDLSFPLAAAVLYGVDPVVTKFALAQGTPAVVGLAVRTAAAAAVFGGYLGWRSARTGTRPSVPLDRWTVAAGVANTGYLLAYFGALGRAPVVVVTPVMGVSTLFVVGGAAVFLREDERVTARLAGGACVVVLGVVTVALR